MGGSFATQTFFTGLDSESTYTFVVRTTVTESTLSGNNGSAKKDVWSSNATTNFDVSIAASGKVVVVFNDKMWMITLKGSLYISTDDINWSKKIITRDTIK